MAISATAKGAIGLGIGLGLVVWGFSGAPLPGSSSGSSLRRRRRRRLGKRKSPRTLKGSIVCPAEVGKVPAPSGNIKRGDFVAVRASNHAGTFSELVWGLVEGGSKLPGHTVVRLVPAIGDDEVIPPSDHEHGFAIGDRLELHRDCLWEVLRANPHGMALCGTWGEQVAGRPPGGGAPGAAAGATVGMDVLVFVAPVVEGTSLKRGPGWNVENPVWAQIIRESPSRNILRIQLLESPPDPPSGLKLAKGSRLDITRDCIFDTRPGGGG